MPRKEFNPLSQVDLGLNDEAFLKACATAEGRIPLLDIAAARVGVMLSTYRPMTMAPFVAWSAGRPSTHGEASFFDRPIGDETNLHYGTVQAPMSGAGFMFLDIVGSPSLLDELAAKGYVCMCSGSRILLRAPVMNGFRVGNRVTFIVGTAMCPLVIRQSERIEVTTTAPLGADPICVLLGGVAASLVY